MVKTIKKENIKNGLVEEFYNNGQLKRRGNRKNGKENGLWETFHEYDQLSQKGASKTTNKKASRKSLTKVET